MMFAGGQKYAISVAASSTLRDLFEAVSRATDVEPKSLKIIHRGKSLSYDETSLADVRMTNGAKLMALGRKVCNIRTPPWSVCGTHTPQQEHMRPGARYKQPWGPVFVNTST